METRPPTEAAGTDSADGPSQQTGQAATPEALPRDLSQFLVDLSIAMHRVSMYPSGHPALVPALDRLGHRAEQLLQDRVRIAIGIARDRLVIDGLATDARHPILRGLAERLHQHQVAALTFTRGLDLPELTDIVTVLGQDPDRGEGPLGRASAERRARWPHVSMHSLSLGGLDIVEGPVDGAGGGPPVTTHAELWVGLARAALERDVEPAQTLEIEPAVVAQAIDEHQRVEAYDQVVVGYLLQIAEELRTASSAQAQELRRRTSMLVSAMQPDTLARLLEMGGDGLQRQRFVSDAATGMAAGAVVDLVKAAAEASSENVSHGLVRLFTKLAAHADAGTETARPLADTALRDQVRRLMADWSLPDPTPADYRVMLQGMARSAPEPRDPGGEPAGTDPGDPLRIVQMSLEIDLESPALGRAIEALTDQGELPALIDLLQQQTGGELAPRLWAYLTSPEFVRSLLERPARGQADLAALLPYLTGEGLTPLFDLLAESEERHVRRTIFDLLRRAGAAALPLALERLSDPRWYVQRNLLSLLDHAEALPPGFDPSPWIAHEDARVRREALRVAVRIPAVRGAALAAALADADSRIVIHALKAAQDQCPQALLPRIVGLVRNEDVDDDVRASAVATLARASRTRPVLDFLLHLADGDGRRSSWRSGATPPTQTQTAAITALVQLWPQDGRAADLLRRLAASGPPEIRQLVKGGSR